MNGVISGVMNPQDSAERILEFFLNYFFPIQIWCTLHLPKYTYKCTIFSNIKMEVVLRKKKFKVLSFYFQATTSA